jgi:8-oxo-dGTP pyrophosphatase MutT (NUDIX family)
MSPERQRGRVRAIAIGVIHDADRLFVAEGHDSVKDQTFYRPLGGSIEFGEAAADAVQREFLEESGSAVSQPTYIGTLENRFVNDGIEGHEIVLVFATDFVDPALRAVDSVACREESGTPFTARWVPMSVFREGRAPLYPDGLLEMVDA